MYFTLTGDAPFGEDDAKTILVRQLGERADLGMFPSVLGNWFRTAFAAKPEDRFADGAEMRTAPVHDDQLTTRSPEGRQRPIEHLP